MKTASLPSLRVAPAVRAELESLLRPDETVSGFVEQAVKSSIAQRRVQAEFVARGLAARDEAQRTGAYFSADEVLGELRQMLHAAKKKPATPAARRRR